MAINKSISSLSKKNQKRGLQQVKIQAPSKSASTPP